MQQAAHLLRQLDRWHSFLWHQEELCSMLFGLRASFETEGSCIEDRAWNLVQALMFVHAVALKCAELQCEMLRRNDVVTLLDRTLVNIGAGSSRCGVLMDIILILRLGVATQVMFLARNVCVFLNW